MSFFRNLLLTLCRTHPSRACSSAAAVARSPDASPVSDSLLDSLAKRRRPTSAAVGVVLGEDGVSSRRLPARSSRQARPAAYTSSVAFTSPTSTLPAIPICSATDSSPLRDLSH